MDAYYWYPVVGLTPSIATFKTIVIFFPRHNVCGDVYCPRLLWFKLCTESADQVVHEQQQAGTGAGTGAGRCRNYGVA